jgi:hypothetical protein
MRPSGYCGVGVQVRTRLLFYAFMTMDLPSGVTGNGPPGGTMPAMIRISGPADEFGGCAGTGLPDPRAPVSSLHAGHF